MRERIPKDVGSLWVDGCSCMRWTSALNFPGERMNEAPASASAGAAVFVRWRADRYRSRSAGVSVSTGCTSPRSGRRRKGSILTRTSVPAGSITTIIPRLTPIGPAL